jgi:hypothetical protein
VLILDPDQQERSKAAYRNGMDWQPISIAPFDRDLELAVIDQDGPHVLVFPCHRASGLRASWANSETGKPVEVHPTHWREWQD